MLDAMMQMMGLDREGFIRELASTRVASEADIRRMVECNDVAGLRKLAQQNEAAIRRNKRVMQQGRYMGAHIPR